MKLTQQDKEYLASKSIILALEHYNIKNETGDKVDFHDHLWQYDIYRDFSPKIAVQKPAQVGLSLLQIIKVMWAVKNLKMDAIYTLPTVADAKNMASGKFNRIIANNPIMQGWTQDKDSVEQKQIGDNMLYIRGTWTDKAAMMVSSDLNIYDEVDASKQDIIDAYSTRLQHSDRGWEWWFSHPSIEGFGVNKHFIKSDQKHWFIKCPHCEEEQHLTFPENIDLEQEIYICKHCKGELQDEDRRKGRWVKKYKDREISGYQVTSMMCSWISAKKIKEYYLEKSEEYFYTKVLGLPYVGKGNTVNETKIYDCVEDIENDRDERIVIGCDTGLTQWYVMGNKNGIFYYGSSKGYEEIEMILKEYRNAILVMDAKGDLTQPRILQERYPNRVFLCEYRQDRKTQQLVTWGANRETGTVVADRNRMIQLVVDEFDRGLMTLNGKKDEYHDYVSHFKNIYRIEEDDMLGIPRRKWERKGDDHLVHATVYWRVGMSKYANTAGVLMKQDFGVPVHDSITVIGDKGIVTNTKSHEWRLY
jgi:hypothetical protein